MPRRYDTSILECKECRSLFPIQRPINKQRKEGHIKDLWCPKCQKITKHVEKGVY